MLRASTNRLLRRSAPNTLYTAARALSSAPGGPELELLEQLLKSAKARQAAPKKVPLNTGLTMADLLPPPPPTVRCHAQVKI